MVYDVWGTNNFRSQQQSAAKIQKPAVSVRRPNSPAKIFSLVSTSFEVSARKNNGVKARAIKWRAAASARSLQREPKISWVRTPACPDQATYPRPSSGGCSFSLDPVNGGNATISQFGNLISGHGWMFLH